MEGLAFLLPLLELDGDGVLMVLLPILSLFSRLFISLALGVGVHGSHPGCRLYGSTRLSFWSWHCTAVVPSEPELLLLSPGHWEESR